MISRLKKFLLKDPLRRGVALAFALLLYYQLNMLISHNTDTVQLEILVTLEPRDGLKQISAGEVLKVKLEVHVPRNCKAIPADAVKINVPVGSRDYSKKEHCYSVKITKRNVVISDPQITFFRFLTPDENLTLKLNLMHNIKKAVPVRLIFSGRAVAGAIPQGQCVPSKVWVTGPENIVEDLQYVNTTPIPIEDISHDFEYEATLHLPTEIKAYPAKVNVQITLEKFSVRQIFGLPVRILGVPENGRAEVVTPLPNGVTVVLKGAGESFSRLTLSQLKVFADAAELRSFSRRRVKLNCFVDVPGVTVTGMQPAEIELKMTK